MISAWRRFFWPKADAELEKLLPRVQPNPLLKDRPDGYSFDKAVASKRQAEQRQARRFRVEAGPRQPKKTVAVEQIRRVK